MKLYSRQGKRGSRWYCDITINGKRIRKSMGDSEGEALESLVKLYHSHTGTGVAPDISTEKAVDTFKCKRSGYFSMYRFWVSVIPLALSPKRTDS